MKRLAAAGGQGGDWLGIRIAEFEKPVAARDVRVLIELVPDPPDAGVGPPALEWLRR